MEKTKKFKWSEERHLFEMAMDILKNSTTYGSKMDVDYDVDEYDEFLTIYHCEGYCFKLEKAEQSDDDQIVEDGFVYKFHEPWEEFKEARYTGAVEVLSRYSNVKRK
jgi:hypothetical protein